MIITTTTVLIISAHTHTLVRIAAPQANIFILASAQQFGGRGRGQGRREVYFVRCNSRRLLFFSFFFFLLGRRKCNDNLSGYCMSSLHAHTHPASQPRYTYTASGIAGRALGQGLGGHQLSSSSSSGFFLPSSLLESSSMKCGRVVASKGDVGYISVAVCLFRLCLRQCCFIGRDNGKTLARA